MLNSTQASNLATSKTWQYEFAMTTWVLTHIWPGIIVFGITANIVNIVVFFKTRTKDNVTILLLGLATSDLLFLPLISPTVCGRVLFAFVKPNPWPFDPLLFMFTMFWPAYTAYDISAFISVSLGLMRCACVTMPLKFKSMFTKSRTLKWLVFLVVLAVSLRIPVLTVFRIAFRRNPATNSSEPYLTFNNREAMYHIDDILNRNIVMNLAFITMILCVIVLSFKLYEASKVRRSSTAQSTKDSQFESGGTNDTGLSSKDLRVVQSVTLVCVIFVLSQIVFVGNSLARIINPELNPSQRFEYVWAVFNQIPVTCSYLNASLNIFVYLRYNRKFRAGFKSLFLGKSKQ